MDEKITKGQEYGKSNMASGLGMLMALGAFAVTSDKKEAKKIIIGAGIGLIILGALRMKKVLNF